MRDLRDELQAVRKANGFLTPEAVVQAATPDSHPLHNRFEWDDTVAGHRWRVHQAHELIRSVTVQRRDTSGEPKVVREYHAVRATEPPGYVYETLDEIAASETLTEIVLRDMEREWRQLFMRYERFQEFIAMVRQTLAETAA